jgi:hypothetical protein
MLERATLPSIDATALGPHRPRPEEFQHGERHLAVIGMLAQPLARHLEGGSASSRSTCATDLAKHICTTHAADIPHDIHGETGPSTAVLSWSARMEPGRAIITDALAASETRPSRMDIYDRDIGGGSSTRTPTPVPSTT